MKISAIRSLIKEAISDMLPEVSLKLSNGKIIHGKARKKPKRLSLQIGSNTYFYFWEGKFILSGTGDVTIVRGVDDDSQEWFLKATEEYIAAMHDAYPERFKYNTTGPIGMNESTSRDAFMAGWSQSKANLGKGKVKGDIRDVDAWMEYSQGKGSEEEKDAFIQGWFKGRTTTDLSDVKIPMNESTSRTVIIKSTEEWEDLANNLKGYKYSGSLKPVSVNRGLIQLSNYAKYPYEVIIDDEAKMIEFGEHTLDK